jgi:pimeloyl-ACP methyl ester carboxylesterase
MRLLLLFLLTLPTWAQDLAFARSGKGPGVVLIHGFAGNRDVWKDLAKQLAKKHTVLAVDLPGCGASPAPLGSQVDFGAVAEQVSALVAKELKGRTVVIAHSMGGLVAVRLAARHPEQLRGLVLLDAPLLPMEGTQADTLAKALEEGVAEAFRARYAAFATSPEQLDRVVGEAARVPGSVLAAYTRGRMVSVAPEVGRVACPVLLIASPILLPKGLVPEAEARERGYGDFKTLQVVRLAGVGHWLMWDEPELVAKALKEFIGNLGKP